MKFTAQEAQFIADLSQTPINVPIGQAGVIAALWQSILEKVEANTEKEETKAEGKAA
jgi:hypothetical protein